MNNKPVLEKGSIRERVYKIVNEAGKQMTNAEVASLIGPDVRRQTLDTTLGQLFKKGLIRRVAIGIYAPLTGVEVTQSPAEKAAAKVPLKKAAPKKQKSAETYHIITLDVLLDSAEFEKLQASKGTKELQTLDLSKALDVRFVKDRAAKDDEIRKTVAFK